MQKLASTDPNRPNQKLRSLDQYFWYTAADGITRLVTSSDTHSEIPQQIDDYEFHPAVFANDEYPSTFPAGRTWPPKQPAHLLRAVGSEGGDCVGNTCYANTVCEDTSCKHTFASFKASAQDWQHNFELFKTEDRGFGVYTKRAFKKGYVLGWYAGEVVPSTGADATNDYLMEMPIGFACKTESGASDTETEGEDSLPTPPPSLPAPATKDVTVMIDARRKGNWTRFINHSCEAHCEFRMRRVGGMRIMVIEAIKDIKAGLELSVNYGSEYYGRDTKKICCCGAERCVSEGRKEGITQQKEKRVKRCKRLTPPPD
jgi:hypothetical protein